MEGKWVSCSKRTPIFCDRLNSFCLLTGELKRCGWLYRGEQKWCCQHAWIRGWDKLINNTDLTLTHGGGCWFLTSSVQSFQERRSDREDEPLGDPEKEEG